MNIKIFISFAQCSPEKYEQKKPCFVCSVSQGGSGEDRAYLNFVRHKVTPDGREIASLSARPIVIIM